MNDETKSESVENKELLCFLLARVTTLEATLEAILTYMPSIGNLSLEEQMRRAKILVNRRADYADLFLENIKEQFPTLAPHIAEHMDLAFSKLKEKYEPKKQPPL